MLILVKDSESSSDVKGSLMQVKKVSPKGPSDSKIHCDLLYKNYVRGWVLVDEVPTINGKIAMGFRNSPLHPRKIYIQVNRLIITIEIIL